MTVVAKVWIDEDCITCDACQDIAPEVFEVTDETSQILAAAVSYTHQTLPTTPYV